jgi:hypothetical protein
MAQISSRSISFSLCPTLGPIKRKESRQRRWRKKGLFISMMASQFQ